MNTSNKKQSDNLRQALQSTRLNEFDEESWQRWMKDRERKSNDRLHRIINGEGLACHEGYRRR
jgi:hypothetical protein